MTASAITGLPDVAWPILDVMDIGAMGEGTDRYAGLVAQSLARVTGFEPDAAQFAKLAARTGPYRYLPYFLGDGQPATCHVARYPGCTSLYEPDPAVIDLFTSIGAGPGGNFELLRTVPVATRRLDDVPNLAPPDWIKLDVQGAELDILRHGTATAASALVIECEVEFLPLYKKQPLFGDVHAFLAGQGFALHKLIDVAGRCLRPFVLNGNPFAPMSQMLFADAVFVRDFSKLERYQDADLLKAALILHEAYASCDLAAYLLREHDRRGGGALAGRYLEAVSRAGSMPLQFLNLKLHA